MDRDGCATRKVSLRVVQVMWPGGCWRGVLLRHWLGERGVYRSMERQEMFALEQFICKLCGDFIYPPIWPGWDWREGFG